VVRLVWSNDLENYVSGSVATGRASHAIELTGDDPDKRDTLVLQAGGWGMRLTTSPLYKYVIVEEANNGCQLDNSSERPRKSYKTMNSFIATWNVSVRIEQEC
jgi:hypothetical protein